MKPSKYLKEITCLYVEDDDMIRESFSLMISRYFKELYVAKNGKEGLEIYKEKNPDLIISDIRMPVMDGIEMVKEIKSINSKAIVIFITAFNEIEYLKAAIDLGVEGYLNKPIDRNKLLQKLNFLAEFIVKEREVQEYYELLKTMFNQFDEAIVLLEKENIKLYNKEFEKLFFDKFNLLKEKIKEIETSGRVEFDSKVYMVKKITISNKYTLLTLKDITDLNNEIFIDQLTKVYNRKILNSLIEKKQNSFICILMVDLDKFKSINDTKGHQFGDIVLQETAKTIKNSLRKDDFVIRFGGEEFLIILDNIEDTQTALKIAKKIHKEIEDLIVGDVNVTASIGVCCDRINSKEDFEKLLKKADDALYKAKEEGRNRVELCLS